MKLFISFGFFLGAVQIIAGFTIDLIESRLLLQAKRPERAADSFDEEVANAPPSPYDQFRGRFQLVEVNNMDEFLKALNMPKPIRELAPMIRPAIEIKNAGDKFQWTVITKGIQMPIRFRLNESFERSAPFGGNKATVKIVADGNKMIKTFERNGQAGRSEFVFEGDQIKETSTYNGVTMTSLYQRIKEDQ